MTIEGFNEEQIAMLVEMWNLRCPIDVHGFLKRSDISLHAKENVKQAGQLKTANPTTSQRAHSYRRMQGQILIEVARLDKQRNPLSAPEDGDLTF